jgi:large subunit ribosomal protein L10
MDRAQKEAAVAELTEDLKGAEAIFAVDYRGISVTDAAQLRGRLREADAVFRVVKNRLAKRAVADAGPQEIDGLLLGPTALTLIHGDAVIAAKAIADFAKEHSALEYKGGVMDGEVLDPEGFAVISRLPGVDALRGQLVGVAASPITGLVRGLSSMMSGLAIALGQIAEQGLVSGEPPAEATAGAPAPEAADKPEPEVAAEPEADEQAKDEPAAEEEPAVEGEPAAEEQPPAEHAEEEAQPQEPERPPADEPPGELEISEPENEEGGEQAPDESEGQD